MNADAFRQLYAYHFAWNRFLWEQYVMPLPYEQFTQASGYSRGSIRDQLVHLMDVDQAWFIDLRGAAHGDPYSPPEGDDRHAIRARWDGVEAEMRAYLAGVTDGMLLENPIPEEEDKDLFLWQVLIHVCNHGTDHRAQVLRQLNDLGVETTSQDYIFYAYENA